MKKLSEIYECNYDVLIKDIKINSKEVKDGDIFVCTTGITADRHDFIDAAISNGAKAIVVSKDIKKDIPIIKVENTNTELPLLARRLYDYNDELTLIGVTGTDGKTTTATIIRQLLGLDKCGFIGSVGVFGKEYTDSSPNTTPDSHLLYKYLGAFVKEKLKYTAMEVSSESYYYKRLNNLNFNIGVFTNITRDHLNTHKTIENYIACKKELFRSIPKTGYAILNMDDPLYKEFLDVCNCNVMTYGKDENATLIIKDYKEYEDKTDIIYKYKDIEYKIESPLVGSYNVYNLAAAILVLISEKYDIKDLINKVPILKLAPGRSEVLDFGQNYKIVLDYAHTPNALKNILSYLNVIKKGKIITITGSAGGREKEKRTDMGKICQELSDLVIYTMDDPRHENVTDIINDLIDKTKDNYMSIEDRKEAIKKAFDIANENDTILIAGKGRDNYMAVEDKYLEYNDYNVIKEYFESTK